MKLTDELTIEEQQDILMTLFGFDLINEGTEKDPHYVLYDEEGFELNCLIENLQFDLITLAGIFSYATDRAKNQGYSDAQNDIRKVLGF